MAVSTYLFFVFTREFVFSYTLARMNLVMIRIKQILHKVMTFLAILTFSTFLECLVQSYIQAPFSFVVKILRRPSKILKSVCVVTLGPVVFLFQYWAK